MIQRADHSDDYFCMLNSAVRDARLSFEARGFLAYLLSMSDEWEFSINGLMHQTGLPRAAVMRLVKELKRCGYVKQRRTQNGQGQFTACVWDVCEKPTSDVLSTVVKTSTVDNQPHVVSDHSMGSPTVWVEPQCGFGAPIRNTNKEEIPKNKEIPKEKKYQLGRGEFSNVYIADSDFEKLTERFGEARRDSLIEDLSRYLANHPKKKYANHYATILSWARKDEKATAASPAPIPQKADGDIDWDRVAQMAMEGGRL